MNARSWGKVNHVSKFRINPSLLLNEYQILVAQ